MSTVRKPFDRYTWVFIGSVLVIPIAVFLLMRAAEGRGDLPILGPSTKDAQGERVHHRILDFELTDQTGMVITQDVSRNKIVVAGFFFASCPTICPEMTRSLKRVQQKFNSDEVVILYHTVDPKRDSVAVLAKYAERFDIHNSNWHLLTGDKQQIYLLARNSYFITALEGDGGANDFIHSELLALVDREGRIRGYYDGTDPRAVGDLIRDIKGLN